MKAETETPLDVAYQQKVGEVEDLRGDSPWSFWTGPAFLLCTLALVSWLSPQELTYWLLATLSGMALCVRYRMRGCIWAVFFLVVFSAARHGSMLEHHVLYFGIEGSLACSFLIMSLAIDQRFSKLKHLQEKSSAQALTIGHLEQHAAKLMESSQAQLITLQEKIREKEKEFEDVQSELSSISILNEVLRKTTAAQLKESREKSDALIDRERRVAFLTSERDELERQLETLRSESSLLQEHEKIAEQLNEVRCEYAQLQLMHEHLENAYQQKTNSLETSENFLQEARVENRALQEKLDQIQKDHEELKIDRENLWEKLQGTFASEEAIRQWQSERSALEAKFLEASEKIAAKTAEARQLEERLAKTEKAFEEKKHSLEKSMQALQNQFDESVSECFSLSTLTDTLREELARQKDLATQLSSEKEALADELDRAYNESLLIQENVKLSDELRAKEYDLEQLTKELHNVSYLYDKQSDHAEEIHQKLCAFSAEKQAIQQEIGTMRAENQMLKTEVEQLKKDSTSSLSSIQKLQELHNEKNFLQERLKTAELELATLSKRQTPAPLAPKESPALQAERQALFEKLTDTQSRLAIMEERVRKASQTEALYQQLKAQFEEKNVILHETRSQLFRADTELEKLRLEKQQKELESSQLPDEIQTAVSQLETELSDLAAENQQLQEMISQLLKEKSQ